MRFLTLLLVLGLWGCTFKAPPHQLPLPPPLESPPRLYDKDYFGHATDTVWFMYRVYDYTDSVSRYARAQGWRPPDVPKVCKFTPYPTLDTLPKITLDGVAQRDIPKALATHLRTIRLFYNAQALRLSHAERLALENCLY